ncbi:UNVERIFIED_CONTAM: hypothetical protein FKN15_063948 [Acipenser sinensis]
MHAKEDFSSGQNTRYSCCMIEYCTAAAVKEGRRCAESKSRYVGRKKKQDTGRISLAISPAGSGRGDAIIRGLLIQERKLLRFWNPTVAPWTGPLDFNPQRGTGKYRPGMDLWTSISDVEPVSITLVGFRHTLTEHSADSGWVNIRTPGTIYSNLDSPAM